MEYIEAKELLENSVRCVAISMEQIRRRLLDQVVGRDEPMQDHLAECTWAIQPYEWSSMEDCLKYLEHLYDGLKHAAEHDDVVNRQELYINNVALIADMLRGFTLSKYPDYLLNCARDVSDNAQTLLRKYASVKTEKNRRKCITLFLNDVKERAKEYGVNLNVEGNFSLPLAYLHDWMCREFENYGVIN